MLGEVIERIAAARPDATAAIDDRGVTLSYADLIAASDDMLRDIGPERQLILLEGQNSCAWLVAYVAGLRGGHPMLIAPGGNPDALGRLQDSFRPSLRLTADRGFQVEHLSERPPELHPDLALMLSTSGSTGSAKCVRLSAASLHANAASIGAYLALGPDERGVVSLPTHYSYGLSIVNSHLHAGATLLLTGESVVADDFWTFCARHGATSFAGVPHSYDLLARVELPSRAPASLRYFTQAGGRLPEAQMRQFATLAERHGWRFFVMYGQTEATARMAYVPPADALRKAGTIGIAIPGGALSLRDEDGAAIEAVEQVGELVYAGPNVMMGYATSPDHLRDAGQPPVLATGDLAVRDTDGFFRIVGRLSRFIKIFGNRIGLDDVERLLADAGHPAIATGIDDQLLVATRDASAVPAIAAMLRRDLKLPDAYFTVRVVEDYPLLASGKIDYAGLKASIPARADAAPATARRDPAAVGAAFIAAFGDRGHEETASFASLGGDSLNYVSVALALEGVLGDLPDDWPALSIGQLTALAEERADGELPAARTAMPRNLETLRAIACLLVVVYHVVGLDSTSGLRLPDGSIWLRLVDSLDFIRMPLFTAMAGFLYAAMPAPGEGLGPFLRRKVALLAAPLLFVTLVNWLGRSAAYGVRDDLIWGLLHGYLHLWFVYALMVLFVIVGVLDCYVSMAWRFWAVVFLLTPFAAMTLPFVYLFSISEALHLLPFFVLGMLLHRRPQLMSSRPLLTLAGAGAVVLLALQQLVLSGLMAQHWLLPMGIAGGCAIVLLALHFFPRLIALEVLGAYSFTIYLWHPMGNAAVRQALRIAGVEQRPVLFLLGLAGGMLLPVMLHTIMTRAPRWISLPVIGR
ncbi:AMP-binding protein [uncultured Sphingomonas sp.]|uniref:AMP-binding protein n=1 Tax=uncultured Sphingomonas sp. TaxID=158754 RepID=UPI0025D6D684|nr:AMP-binding protein [uncultured Sphingomonas sp.]